MKNEIVIRQANLDDVNTIGFLAHQIWPVAYGASIDPVQLQYMLDLFYQPAALKKQMLDDGHQFLIAEMEEEAVGFASFSAAEKPGDFKLHKIYVLNHYQGKGLGRTLLEAGMDEVLQKDGKTLMLNVYRQNKARAFYEKLGFRVIDEVDIPIGNGYYMHDYVMQKELT
jgi:diamine N-acetyltransferase